MGKPDESNEQPNAETAPIKHNYQPRKEKLIQCRSCGKEFYSSGNHAYYCPDCRAERAKTYYKRTKEKRSKNARRKIGETTACPMCGAEFTLTVPSQKYCPACQREHETATIPQSVVGVHWLKKEQLWMATYRKKTLGKFEKEEDAIKAREAAEAEDEANIAIRHCIVCGQKIPTDIRNERKLTCSDNCSKIYTRLRTKSELSKRLKLPLKIKKRLTYECKKNNITMVEYISEVLQKEFDTLDKERSAK